ncbi:Cof-type HAD-IIB family hydrolase [Anaerococcus sp. NML200537]|uniref:Cof-type HAD-IIB family hydrolase n=1 Tax=Anaerococcus kampingae TaxID=3115614 RepID=A0ABW9MBB7_9FIRM|nr:Cof-type HAD-IIB family hydrolase [Anaerococcus sp. NML200537]MCW6700518.1 Cof-type HAD-IIB family hydrolase [Anaerococcus sp. NML200537]
MIKLIASDIDETIIDHNRLVPERNKKAIKAAQDKGVIVMLATGRGPYEIFDIPDQAGVIADDRFVICCNGAVIMNVKTKEIIDVLAMDFSYAKKIFEYAYKNKLTFYLYTLDKKYGINLSDETLIAESHINLIEGDNIDFLEGQTVLKTIIKNSNMNQLQALEVDIARITDYNLEISYSSNMYMEINAKGVNKAIALKKVADHYGVDMKNVMAIGDNYNDVAMLEEAGTAIAVRNARLQVKQSADYVTQADNSKGAVGEAIENFVLNL